MIIRSSIWLEYKGKQAYNRHGRPLMKSVAIIRMLQGEKLHWKNKPGWIDGELCNAKQYEDWFDRVDF